MEVKSLENIEFQWYGSPPLPEAHRPFLPGWVDPIDNKGYYVKKRLLSSPPPWTNVDTSSRTRGRLKFDKRSRRFEKNGRVNARYRDKVDRAAGERIKWT